MKQCNQLNDDNSDTVMLLFSIGYTEAGISEITYKIHYVLFFLLNSIAFQNSSERRKIISE